MLIDSAMYCCNPSVGGGAKFQLTVRCIVATLEWGGKVSIDSAMYCCNPRVGEAKCQLTVRCIVVGILPVMGRRGHKYRNCRGMAINMLVQKLCREEEVGFVDLWGSFVGRADMYMKDGLHLSGKGAAVFADKLSAAVDSDMGTMTNIFGSKHCLN